MPARNSATAAWREILRRHRGDGHRAGLPRTGHRTSWINASRRRLSSVFYRPAKWTRARRSRRQLPGAGADDGAGRAALPDKYDAIRKATKFGAVLPGPFRASTSPACRLCCRGLLEMRDHRTREDESAAIGDAETPADATRRRPGQHWPKSRASETTSCFRTKNGRRIPGAPAVGEHVGAPGPGGPANVLLSAYWQTPGRRSGALPRRRPP